MNEYKQELESVIKSVLFKIRKHRYDRLFNVLQQRSCAYHVFSVICLLMVIHGFTDYVNVKFIRVFEFSLSSYDLCVLVSIFSSSFMIIKYYLLYYGFKLYGFKVSS